MKERLRQLRNALDLSQEKMAEQLSVTRQTVYNWESGLRKPTEQTLKTICMQYGASYAWLAHGDGEMFSSMPDALLDDLKYKYGLDDLDVQIVKRYLELSNDERAVFKNFLQSVFK